MSPITRRHFITGIGAATVAVGGGYSLRFWHRDDGDAASPGSPSTSSPTSTASGARLEGRTDRTLVIVELAGGNDGLHTVGPLDDPAYRQLRPTLAVTDAINLDGSIGLSPNLPRLAARYGAGHVAIVEGLGYPDPNLSHFASLASWWTANPGGAGGTGWIGRYLDATVGYDDPLAAISIGSVPSPALLGAQSFATSIVDTSGLQPALPPWAGSADDLVAAWSHLAPAAPDPTSLFGDVRRAVQLTVDARDGLDAVLIGETDASGTGESTVAESFALAAQLVAAEHPPRVVYITGLGDFDTHEGLVARHAALMDDLDAGLDAFFAIVDGAGAADRVIVMTTSEFGRRPAENGSGTDHGTAAPHFVIGSGVRGGRYGEPASLTRLDEHGNLVFTTDLRALYATVLHGWLGVDPAPIVGDGFDPLPLLA